MCGADVDNGDGDVMIRWCNDSCQVIASGGENDCDEW